MPKAFYFRGRTLEELKAMSTEEFSKLLNASERRSLKRGLTDAERKLLEKMRKNPDKFHKTHCREMVIFPEMVGAKFGVFIGRKKEEGGWVTVAITPEMVGHRLGEFAVTCKRVKHSAPGIGATKGSKFIATKT
jgi:small subunit ribosomal protein S19